MFLCACAGAEPSQAKKLDALHRTPFFAAAAEHAAGETLLDLIAAEASLRNCKVGQALDDVPIGTFVVVVEGELVHTEKRAGTSKRAAKLSAKHAEILQRRLDEIQHVQIKAGDLTPKTNIQNSTTMGRKEKSPAAR